MRAATVIPLLDHLAIRAADLSASARFYRTVLATLGIEPSGEGRGWVAWGDFVLEAARPGHPPTRGLHLAFVAADRDRVDDFWRAGVDAGYEDDGAPGERPQYTPGYYGAFLRDPDGNSAEAVRHEFVRGGGNVDHLWIRVADLDAAVAFQEATMEHTGLREGRRWEEGRQFRGAWATLSLVSDGLPPTEGLHLAFPASDPAVVSGFHAAAIAAGGVEALPPGVRRLRGEQVHSAAVIGPGRAEVESIHRPG